MKIRLILALSLLLLASGCASMHCGEQGDGSRASGGCGASTTFLR